MQRNIDAGCEHIVTVAYRHILGRQDIVAGPLNLFQAKAAAALFRRNGIETLHSLEHVTAGFRLLCLLAFEIATNKFLRLVNERLLIFVFTLLLLASQLSLNEEF